MNVFEILRNINSIICHMEEKEKWTERNCFIERLQFEIFVVCLLWKEKYIGLMTVLSEVEQRNELYILGALGDKKHLKFLMKKSKTKPKRKKLINYKSALKIRNLMSHCISFPSIFSRLVHLSIYFCC